MFAASVALMETQFAGAFSETDRFYENQVAPVLPASREWVRMTVRWGKALHRSRGSMNREEHLGNVVVQVFVPEQSGHDRARVIMDDGAEALQMETLTDTTDGVKVCLGRARGVTTMERKGYFQANLDVPFSAYGMF